MRRKSERNKIKGSPEKKSEKPTRKSTRRRGKRATSSSPERDDSQEDTTSDASVSRDISKDSARHQAKDVISTPEESITATLIHDLEGKDSSPETEDNGSVWKVARADASPGEIQKLKLCRQRNISEASDTSSSRKKSHKWQESGEGVAEEVDSSDERLGSPRVEPSGNQLYDTSSLLPGQDSNEEVSDYKETLPETTSANLSDDKPNIDLQADSNEACCSNLSNDIKPERIDSSADPISFRDDAAQAVSTLQAIMTEQAEEMYNQETQQTTLDLETGKEEEIPEREEEVAPERQELGKQYLDQGEEITQEEHIETQYNPAIEQIPQQEEDVPEVEGQVSQGEIPEIEGQVSQEEISGGEIVPSKGESSGKEELSPQVNEESNQVREELLPLKENETLEKNQDTTEKDDAQDSSSEDERENIQYSNSNSNDEREMKVRSRVRASSRSSRRKHRNKYRDSSNSDTVESEDEPSQDRETKQSETPEEEDEVPTEKNYRRDKSRTKSPKPKESSSLLNNNPKDPEVEGDKKEAVDTLSRKIESAILSDTTSSQKPAKINLKRTFSTRISVEENKLDESSLSVGTESIETKENHTNNNTEQKRVPKRRRWGTTLTSDSSIEFSISTDSLKALVPGAKPLSITEVRLSKDDEDEQSRDKDRDKKLITTDNNGEYTVREDTVAQKVEGPRKGDSKTDNHIGLRRKISVLKDIPQVKSPSPPSVKATNILLIKNLVRPFTLTQIRELLSRTGTIVENGFWIDRIKSKCFVEYSNEDQAFETRQALHGISWPVSNPKKLQVEYATKEDMELARETSKDQPNSRKTEPLLQSDSWQREWMREEKNQLGGTKVMVVREWDLGKEDGQQHIIKEEKREKKDFDKKKRQRSLTPVMEVHLPAPARKFKKKEDEPPPAKLLDDLFRKTKATPCIYWLPLTNEQIVVKEEMRRQHMAEHARRLEEMRRAERNRDIRRRRSPRK